MAAFGIKVDVSVFRILRLFRILQLEHFLAAFTFLDDVWVSVRPTLAATGLLALVLWVGSACLFYLFEKVRRGQGKKREGRGGEGDLSSLCRLIVGSDRLVQFS